VRNNGRYEQLKYHFWGYAKVHNNPYENPPSVGNLVSLDSQQGNPISERPLRPRYLCVLQPNEGISIENVSQWEAVHENEPMIEYLFVAYTAEQFKEEEFGQPRKLQGKKLFWWWVTAVLAVILILLILSGLFLHQ